MGIIMNAINIKQCILGSFIVDENIYYKIEQLNEE